MSFRAASTAHTIWRPRHRQGLLAYSLSSDKVTDRVEIASKLPMQGYAPLTSRRRDDPPRGWTSGVSTTSSGTRAYRMLRLWLRLRHLLAALHGIPVGTRCSTPSGIPSIVSCSLPEKPSRRIGLAFSISTVRIGHGGQAKSGNRCIDNRRIATPYSNERRSSLCTRHQCGQQSSPRSIDLNRHHAKENLKLALLVEFGGCASSLERGI